MKKRVGLFKWQVGTFFLANSTVQAFYVPMRKLTSYPAFIHWIKSVITNPGIFPAIFFFCLKCQHNCPIVAYNLLLFSDYQMLLFV